jgi:nitrate/nitrite-specific signal transduction histidine kinase
MRERVDRMQAVLTIDSAAGKGTCVCVTVDPAAGNDFNNESSVARRGESL